MSEPKKRPMKDLRRTVKIIRRQMITTVGQEEDKSWPKEDGETKLDK
jgi:hypothetical protein